MMEEAVKKGEGQRSGVEVRREEGGDTGVAETSSVNGELVGAWERKARECGWRS